MIVKTTAAVPPVAMGNSENTIHGTNRAADPCTNRAADDSADRTGRTAPLTRAFLSAADNALRVSQMRDRQQGQSKRCAR
jgi:hypothetical protein